jgi:hypothetical protein
MREPHTPRWRPRQGGNANSKQPCKPKTRNPNLDGPSPVSFRKPEARMVELSMLQTVIPAGDGVSVIWLGACDLFGTSSLGFGASVRSGWRGLLAPAPVWLIGFQRTCGQRTVRVRRALPPSPPPGTKKGAGCSPTREKCGHKNPRGKSLWSRGQGATRP